MANYCTLINDNISVATCPLAAGTCMWRHRETGLCVFTYSELTVESYCDRVGLDPMTAAEFQDVKSAMLDALRKP